MTIKSTVDQGSWKWKPKSIVTRNSENMLLLKIILYRLFCWTLKPWLRFPLIQLDSRQRQLPHPVRVKQRPRIHTRVGVGVGKDSMSTSPSSWLSYWSYSRRTDNCWSQMKEVTLSSGKKCHIYTVLILLILS